MFFLKKYKLIVCVFESLDLVIFAQVVGETHVLLEMSAELLIKGMQIDTPESPNRGFENGGWRWGPG